MKPSKPLKLRDLHGSPERSSFSWEFGWLCPHAHLNAELLLEHVNAKVKGSKWALENLRKLEAAHNCIVFYIPKTFKGDYKLRFEVYVRDKEKFWSENFKVCGMQMTAVPLPKALGQTTIPDGELSEKHN